MELYDQIRNNADRLMVRTALNGIKISIKHWQNEKDTEKGAGNSVRQTAIDELSQIIVAKIQTNLDDHEVELAPLVAEVNDAFRDGDFDEARTKSEELSTQHRDLYLGTAWTALRANDHTRWATAFFSAPKGVIGAQPIHPMNIKAIQDFSWLTATQADEALSFIEQNASGEESAHIMGMLQHAPFRNALRDKAYGYGALEAKMPLLRVAGAAENDLATRGGGAPSVDDIAGAVFTAFLGDQPLSGLGYATNSAQFKTPKFLVGDTKGAQRAPCMTLSNMMTEVFKAVLPSGVPGAAAVQDMRPMLTRPLATIGLRGILTRETAFQGNVAEFGAVKGYSQVNRIFFGNGHEWLVVGNREYDPTLGISGPIGTIAAQLEPLTFTAKGDGYVASDGRKVTRNKKVPPGGASLLFQRSVVIK